MGELSALPSRALGVVSIQVPSGRVLLALLPVAVLITALVAYCLVDLVRAPSVRYLPKPVWAVVIVAFSTPFGALLYLAVGRNRHEAPADPIDPQSEPGRVEDEVRR